MMDEDIKNLI